MCPNSPIKRNSVESRTNRMILAYMDGGPPDSSTSPSPLFPAEGMQTHFTEFGGVAQNTKWTLAQEIMVNPTPNPHREHSRSVYGHLSFHIIWQWVWTVAYNLTNESVMWACELACSVKLGDERWGNGVKEYAICSHKRILCTGVTKMTHLAGTSVKVDGCYCADTHTQKNPNYKDTLKCIKNK